MSRAFRLVVTALVLVAVISGCHREGRIISANALQCIYSDMFLADQWPKSNPEARKKADTTLFYEPIFRKYGYTAKDFEATIDHYTDRPDKLVKIIQRSAKELNEKYLEYNRIAERIQKVRNDNQKGLGYEQSTFADADSILWGTTVLDPVLVRDSVYIKPAQPDSSAVTEPVKQDDIIQTTIINVTGGDSVRPNKKQAPGKFPRNKPAPVEG